MFAYAGVAMAPSSAFLFYKIENLALITFITQYISYAFAENFGVSAALSVNAVLFGSKPNDYYPIRDMITEAGYPIEVHLNVETEDGYLLNLYRIPYGKSGQTDGTRPVILLMHGLLGSAEDWLVRGPSNGLGYILADSGYDVWMANARGTTHSRKHTRLNPNLDPRYWQFSWHEIGYYDLPANILYIQQETGQNELFYIGHSQGTTAFFVMSSLRPEYNAYIKCMVALAPVAYMAHAPSIPLRFLSTFHGSVGLLTRLIGLNEILPSNYLLELAGQSICHEKTLTTEICANLLFLIGGYDSPQLDRSIITSITKYAPAGASTRQFIHYAQEINSGRFCQYNHGVLANLNRYGSPLPPAYDITKMNVPIAVFYSNNDQLVSVIDVEQLCNELPNLVYQYLVPYEQFNHLDFVYATDVVDLVYNEVLELISKYA